MAMMGCESHLFMLNLVSNLLMRHQSIYQASDDSTGDKSDQDTPDDSDNKEDKIETDNITTAPFVDIVSYLTEYKVEHVTDYLHCASEANKPRFITKAESTTTDKQGNSKRRKQPPLAYTPISAENDVPVLSPIFEAKQNPGESTARTLACKSPTASLVSTPCTAEVKSKKTKKAESTATSKQLGLGLGVRVRG